MTIHTKLILNEFSQYFSLKQKVLKVLNIGLTIEIKL